MIKDEPLLPGVTPGLRMRGHSLRGLLNRRRWSEIKNDTLQTISFACFLAILRADVLIQVLANNS